MKRILLLVFVLSVSVSLALSQEVPTTLWDYHTKAFFSGASVRILTVEATGGQTIRFEVPKGVVLAVYCSNESARRTEKGQTLTEFQGMVSIRTKPFSEIVQDQSMMAQMELTPLRIDIDKAKVTLETKE
jgi:hypothetical protein